MSASAETTPTGLTLAAAPVLASSYALYLVQLVEQLGVGRELLLSQTGISLRELDEPEGYINTSQYHALIHHALRLTNQPALGLYYGRRLNLATHGLLGYAILSSPSLAKTSELTRKYIRLCHRLVKPDFHFRHISPEAGTEAAISIEFNTEDPAIYRFEIENSFSAIQAIWNDLLGNADGLLGLSLRYPPPPYAEVYRQFFPMPVSFGAATNEIRFRLSALKPLKHLTNPTIMLTAEKQCEELLHKLEHDAPDHGALVRHIRQVLLRSQGNFPTLEQMAERLHMTGRTLARKLATEQTSYQQILDRVRRDLAMQCLTRTDLAIDEIAYVLGYQDPANFTRAFRRWTGMNPSQVKRHG